MVVFKLAFFLVGLWAATSWLKDMTRYGKRKGYIK